MTARPYTLVFSPLKWYFFQVFKNVINVLESLNDLEQVQNIADGILTALPRHSNGILTAFWRHTDGILTAYWRHSDGILTAFWRHSYGILKSFLDEQVIAVIFALIFQVCSLLFGLHSAKLAHSLFSVLSLLNSKPVCINFKLSESSRQRKFIHRK